MAPVAPWQAHGLLVRDARNGTFVGKCWPGDSSYLDLLAPEARSYWMSLYTAGTATGRPGWPHWLHAWNDMNEPSVFDSEELTLPRDARHRAGGPAETELVPPADAFGSGAAARGDSPLVEDVEHRVVHNAYGLLQAASSHAGLVARSGGIERPFLLSRSFFVGSARYGALWTGDNTGTWEHLRLSFAMVLTIALSGHSFAGADVGGFFGAPTPLLLARWCAPTQRPLPSPTPTSTHP